MFKPALIISATVVGVAASLAYTPPAPTPPTSPSVNPPPPANGTPSTVQGVASRTPYGPVQVEVTVTAGGQLDAITVLQKPDMDPKSARISQNALPQLVEEALAAQSADVTTISGASYTTEGFRESLTSALNAPQTNGQGEQ